MVLLHADLPEDLWNGLKQTESPPLERQGSANSREIDVFHRVWRLTPEVEKRLREEVRPKL